MEIEVVEPFEVDVENCDLRLEPHCHTRRVGAGHAATENHNIGGSDAWYAPEAQVILHYIGDVGQLIIALEQADLALKGEGDSWTLEQLAGRKKAG